MDEPLANLALPFHAETDAVLVGRASTDEQAFAALYGRYARYVAGVVYRILGNDADVDDLVQETFLDARAALASLEDARALRAWLVTITVRRVHRHLKKRRRRALFFFGIAELSARSSDPRDREAVDDLYDALDTLPPDLRVPWSLARIEQLTLPEVAEACEVSLATVKRRIADADARIQRRLA